MSGEAVAVAVAVLQQMTLATLTHSLHQPPQQDRASSPMRFLTSGVETLFANLRRRDI
jgi:hypothetical protein